MNDEPIRVLVIDDEKPHAEVLAESLERVGYECVIATSGKEGFRKIEDEDWGVILTDLKMADLDGMQIVRKAREETPDAEVVVITGHGDVKTAVEAIKLGAANYLTKPVELGELRAIVDKASQRVRLTQANRELKRQLDEKFGYEGLVGSSPQMHDLIGRLRAIAPSPATVLIRGETGAGKELVARAIHQNSPRKNKSFVPLNCTAFNENLLDDELFGHEPGAFTGADRVRKGRFEHANGGTLFLDEVGDMPMPLQAKLLRVLENKEVFRIGSNEPIKVNVRLLSATHKDLEAMVGENKFRQDLLFRLKVVTVKLPPLRQRREDIQLLSAHFIKEFNAQNGKRVTAIADPIRKAMAIYSWPGNVRELRNFIESAVVQDLDGVISLDDVEESDVVRNTPASGAQAVGPGNLVGRPLTEVERYYIEQALLLTEGNREEAARMLGIGERTLYRVINDWKLQDRIRQGLTDANGSLAEAAKLLNMKPAALERKIKKWGWQPGNLPVTA
jgi:two-component system, NtrC family, response regulator HydG